MRISRKKMLAKRVVSDICENPVFAENQLKDALDEVEVMLNMFGISNPPDILLDSIVNACAFSLLSQAFRHQYNLGSVEQLRLDAFQMSLPKI